MPLIWVCSSFAYFNNHPGELIGLEYLFHQTSEVLLPPMHPDEVEGDDDKDGGSRVGEEVEEDPTQPLPELPATSRQSLGTSRTKPVTPDKGKHFLHVYFGIMSLSKKEQNYFNSLSILISHMRQLPLSYLFIYLFQSGKKNHLNY